VERLMALAGTSPGAPERTLETLVVGLTISALGVSATVLVWGLTLLP
jgi:hypothetical protein